MEIEVKEKEDEVFQMLKKRLCIIKEMRMDINSVSHFNFKMFLGF